MAAPLLEESPSAPVTRSAWDKLKGNFGSARDKFEGYFGTTKDVLTGKAFSDILARPKNELLDIEAYKQAQGYQPGEASRLGGAGRQQFDRLAWEAQGRQAPQAAGGVWSDRFTNLRNQQAAAAGARQGPTIGAGAWQDRASQENLAAMLQAQAAGTAPSAAQQQLMMGGEQALRQAMSLAAGQRGMGGAAALRGAQQAGQTSMLQASQQAAQMRAAEQAAGQQALSQHLAGMRGQEIGLATTQAQLGQQQTAQNDAMVLGLMRQGLSEDQARAQVEQATQQMNLGAQLQSQQQKDAMTQFLMSQGLSRDLAEQQAEAELERMRLSQAQAVMNAQAGMQAGNIQAINQQRAALVGGASGILGSLLTKGFGGQAAGG